MLTSGIKGSRVCGCGSTSPVMEVKVVLLIVSFVSCGLTGGGEQETSPKNYGGKDPLSYIPSIPELSTR